MSDNEIESDEIMDDFEDDEELSNIDKKTVARINMESKRKLEDYFEDKRLEKELNYYF